MHATPTSRPPILPRGRAVVYGVVLAIGLAVWWNIRVPARQPVRLADKVTDGVADGVAGPAQASGPDAETTAALPEAAGRPLLAPAERDPFVAIAPSVAPPAPVAPAPSPPAMVPPPAPTPPPLAVAFQGRMTTPDGRQIVFATLGDSTVQLTVGQTLANGYRVESISSESVEFSYPPMNTTARLELPAPPRHEVR